MRGIAASFLGVAPIVAELFAAMGLADVDLDAAFFDFAFFGADDVIATFMGATFFDAADFGVAVLVAGDFLAGDRAEVILGEVII